MTAKAGVAGTESGPIHSGATFVDYDRDGWLDLYVGSYVAFDQNSRRYCNIGGVLSSCPPSAYSGSPNALYHNNGNGTFANVSAAANILQSEGKNLSVGAADYDNDGCIDVVVANSGDPPTVLPNACPRENHFVNFKLVGTKSNRDALGARVHLSAGRISQIRKIAAGGSYLSQSELRANFGLGSAAAASTV